MPAPSQLTARGFERLQQTLRREQIRLDEARDYVRDQLESNEAESLNLVEAQQQLATLEERVEELQELLATAQILEAPAGTHDVVQLGDVVLLTHLGSSKTQRVQLVTAAEAAGALDGVVQVSPDSPVGSRLQGGRVGDIITVTLKQDVLYRIEQIETSPDR